MTTSTFIAISAAAVTLLTATGCSSDPATAVSTTNPAEARAVVDAARARWDREGPERYDYTIDQSCFCAFVGRARVEVRDGTVTRVVSVETGEEVQTAWFVPIEGLFDQIESRLEFGPDRVDLSFEPDLGYPTSAFVDVFRIADEELRFSIEALVAR